MNEKSVSQYSAAVIEEIRQGKRTLPPGKTDRKRHTTKETYMEELEAARGTIHGELRRLLAKDPLATRAHLERVIRKVSKFEDEQIAGDIASIREILG